MKKNERKSIEHRVYNGITEFQAESEKIYFSSKKIDVEYEILKKNERKSIEHRVYNGITESRAENEKILLWNEKNR